MQCDRKILVAMCASLGLAAATGGANAACALAGVWHFYDMQTSSPNISTNFTSVVVGPNLSNKKNLETFNFTNSSKGYDNNTVRLIQCKMAVKASGKFTAPCTSYGVNGTETVSVTGTLALNGTCDLSGTIVVAGDPVNVTIQGAHINGIFGAGVATQGGEFHNFSLVKQ
jgi:hypothetical protein